MSGESEQYSQRQQQGQIPTKHHVPFPNSGNPLGFRNNIATYSNQTPTDYNSNFDRSISQEAFTPRSSHGDYTSSSNSHTALSKSSSTDISSVSRHSHLSQYGSYDNYNSIRHDIKPNERVMDIMNLVGSSSPAGRMRAFSSDSSAPAHNLMQQQYQHDAMGQMNHGHFQHNLHQQQLPHHPYHLNQQQPHGHQIHGYQHQHTYAAQGLNPRMMQHEQRQQRQPQQQQPQQPPQPLQQPLYHGQHQQQYGGRLGQIYESHYIHSGSGDHNSVGSSRSRQSTHSTGGSNAQGRAINKMLLEILRDKNVDSQRLDQAIESHTERMDCVNLATLLFHTGKKRILLVPAHVKRIAERMQLLTDELRAREASNSLYGLRCMSSDVPEVRELLVALANKIASSSTNFIAQAVGNALYGLQLMSSEYEEVRYLLRILTMKVSKCTELLEAQNVGNALYGMRGMNSDHPEVREVIAALTPKVATAREDLNGQALGNSLYGLQCMSAKEPEVRCLLSVLATKVSCTWENLKAQEVGNALYGLKRMSSDVPDVRMLIAALVPKIAASGEILDAQAIGNSFYGMQNMRSDCAEVLSLLNVMAEKANSSYAELDGQAMGNSLYGLQGMSSECPEVRTAVSALAAKVQASCLDLNAQELGNALFGLQNMTSEHADVRNLLAALAVKVASSKFELTSQEIGNTLCGLQGMSSSVHECRGLIRQLSVKIRQSRAILDPLGVANSLFGLKRMSSECEDVRFLVQALAHKVEQGWKPLGAANIALGLYGLQGLSGSENETRSLISAIVPKIFASRELMSASQISSAMFGMKNLSSDYPEVLTLLGAIREKLEASEDAWTMSNLSSALFGLQGMSSDAVEVLAVVQQLVLKTQTINLQMCDVESNDVGNCVFGLQRMDSSDPSVGHMVSFLAEAFAAIPPTQRVRATVCASIIYGLHGGSAKNECVARFLALLVERIQVVNNLFAANSCMHDMHGSDNASIDSNQTASGGDSVEDILSLFQCMALSLFAMKDMDASSELTERLYSELSALRSAVDMNKSELSRRQMSPAEQRMANELRDVLLEEPFVVQSNVLVHGFEMQTFVQLRPGVSLRTVDDQPWVPRLNVELCGTSYSMPAKQLFFALRKHYLLREHNVHVDYVPVEAFRADTYRGFAAYMSILSPLFPPTAEDARNFAAALTSMGFSHGRGLMSSVKLPRGRTGSEDSFHSNSVMGVVDYVDDDFMKNVVSSFNDSKKFKHRLIIRVCKPLKAMPIGWLGLLPELSRPTIHTSSEFGFGFSSPQQANPMMASAQGGYIGSKLSSTSTSSAHSGMITSLQHMQQVDDDYYSLQLSPSGRTTKNTTLTFDSSDVASNSYAAGNKREIRVDLSNLRVDTAPASPQRRSPDKISTQSSASSRTARSISIDQPGTPLTRTPCGSAVQSGVPYFPSSAPPHPPVSMNVSSSVSSSISTDASEFFRSDSQHFTGGGFIMPPAVMAGPVGIAQAAMKADAEGDDVDAEIAALEAQLEVARLEARLKLLKAQKKGKALGLTPPPAAAAAAAAASTAGVTEGSDEPTESADRSPIGNLQRTMSGGKRSDESIPRIGLDSERSGSSYSSLADFPTELQKSSSSYAQRGVPSTDSNSVTTNFISAPSADNNSLSSMADFPTDVSKSQSWRAARGMLSSDSSSTNVVSAPSADVCDALNESDED